MTVCSNIMFGMTIQFDVMTVCRKTICVIAACRKMICVRTACRNGYVEWQYVEIGYVRQTLYICTRVTQPT